VLRVAQHTIRLAGALAAAVVLGCAGHPPGKSARALSSRYFGVWVNIGPSFHNWWEIGPSGAVTYGYDGADGACNSVRGTVLAPDRLEVHYGTTTRLYLRRAEGDLLLFVTEDLTGVAVNKRVDVASICRRPDGTYAAGAPAAPSSH